MSLTKMPKSSSYSMNLAGWFAAMLLTVSPFSPALAIPFDATETPLYNVEQSSASRLTVTFSAKESAESLLPVGTGEVIANGQPSLPMTSCFVIVPPNAGIEFSYRVGGTREIVLDQALELTSDDNITTRIETAAGNLFPPVAAEVSEPIVIRGVRLVKVTTYPAQYDKSSRKLIVNDRIVTDLRFTNDDPINPARYSDRIRRSGEFNRFINALAVNAGTFGFDDGDEIPEAPGHYLVAAHENCVQYVAPFIEWRRKSGYKVDILSIPDEVAESDPDEIKALIQARYDAYLEAGLDPFDQLLLVGDRSSYPLFDNPDEQIGPRANWVLEAPTGESIWPPRSGGPQHADYKYACLEGDDNYPDVGFARFCAGADSVLNLFVGRTLGYEATPYMEDTRWFRRGAVYSAHWGNDPQVAWHVNIHTNLRWAEELLRRKNFNDVRLMEDYEYEQFGGRAGVFERGLFTAGTNLMLGRVETLYWREREPNVDSPIFPIRFTLSGHGEYAAWMLLRSGTGEHLKGPVVATCGWGGPTTVAVNAVWLETTASLLNRDLSYGWSRALAVTIAENYFSNFDVQWGEPIYGSIKTDFDYYGDPGLKPWMGGAPSVVNATFPATVSPDEKSINIAVLDEDRNYIQDADVTLYAPGRMPAFDDEAYSDYDDMQVWRGKWSPYGYVVFVPEDVLLVRGTPLYVTVTGHDIMPFFGMINIGDLEAEIDYASYELTETEGNNDGQINPGETFSLSITAINQGQNAANDVSGFVFEWRYVTILSDPVIEFGNLGPGEAREGRNEVSLRLASDCPDGNISPESRPRIDLIFDTDQELNWNSEIEFNVSSPKMSLRSINAGYVVPIDDTLQLDMVLENIGRQTINRFGVKLLSLSPGVIVEHDSVTYPPLDPGEREWCNGRPLYVSAHPEAVPGAKCPMLFVIAAEGGFIDSINFELTVGEMGENCPQGPDSYGYICFDDSDVGWESAPAYDWIEINPEDENAAYEGIQMAFPRATAFDAGAAIAVPLPFPFSFYGQDFDTITVGLCGYLAPGNQSRVVNPNNWPLDRGMGGGVGMMAPLWDWLKFDQSSNIYYYVDRENGRVIVEWYRVRTRSPSQNSHTFQVILYDRTKWARESGDTDILYQYFQVTNVADTSRNEGNDISFASVGISSPDGKTGLSYTFRNQHPVTSEPLGPRTAQRYTTSILKHAGVVMGSVFEEATGNPLVGASVGTGYGLLDSTNASGRFVINNVVNDAEFMLIAHTEGLAESIISGLSVAEGETLFVDFRLEPVTVEQDERIVPKSLAIKSLYPNPFNSKATLQFDLDRPEFIRLKAFNLQGREVDDLWQGRAEAGSQSITFEAGHLPSGIYILRLEAGTRSAQQKVVLVR